MNQFETIIIGGGIAGLTAANYLLSEGEQVLLLEKNNKPGGYCTSFVDAGFLFDGAATMVSGIGGEGYIKRAFQAMKLSYEKDLLRLTSFEKIMLGEEEFTIPADFNDFMQMLKERFPEDSAGIDQYVTLIQAIFEDMEKVNSWVIPAVKNIQLFPKHYPVIFAEKNTSFEEMLERYFSNEILKNLFRAQCFRLGLIPETTSLINFAGNWYYTYSTSPAYLKGGIGRLAEILAEGIVKKGGVMMTNAECMQIIIEEGVAKGVRLADGQEFRAKRVISNIDARKTFYELVGKEYLKPALTMKMERLIVSPSAFIVYLGLDVDIRQYKLQTGDLWYFDPQAFGSDLAEQSFGWNRLYLSSPTVKDAYFKSEGKASLMLFKTTQYHSPEYWEVNAESYCEQILNFAERVIPQLKDKVIYRKYATPVDLEKWTKNHEGAVAGWAPIPAQSGFLRMTRDTTIPGLYLTGHWTAPGPGVMASLVSGMKVGQMILTEGR